MKIIFALLTLVSFNALASEQYACSFTEPFINLKVDLASKTLDYTFFDEETRHYAIDSVTEVAGVIEIKTEAVGLKIDKNEKGSDGMSDLIYDATGILDMGSEHKLIGGCNAGK